MNAKCIAILGIALAIVGCKGPQEPVEPTPAPAPTPTPAVEPAPTPAPAITMVAAEVEGFTLTGADIKDLAGAGGNKVVVLKDDASKAETTVNLKKGKYELVVYAFAPSYDEDAFYVTVDGVTERLFPSDEGKLLPSEAVTFTQTKDGPCKVSLGFGEPNVQLDRVEIKPAE